MNRRRLYPNLCLFRIAGQERRLYVTFEAADQFLVPVDALTEAQMNILLHDVPEMFVEHCPVRGVPELRN